MACSVVNDWAIFNPYQATVVKYIRLVLEILFFIVYTLIGYVGVNHLTSHNPLKFEICLF